MSFTFNWPRFSDQFHYDAIQMLNTALNKGNKPPIIADKIEVVELEMGTQPPELEIRDIGDLTVDQFRGIFRMTYAGDAHLVLKTKVQANPLNHKQPDIHLMGGSRGMLAAKHPLVVPMLLRLSHFKLSSYVVLVVSKQKGITLVFKTDPLQNVDINSTFDSIAVIQNFIQREIEGQLRQMFREDLPGIIHRLSQQWVKAKVEAPYLNRRPPPITRHTFDTMSAPDVNHQKLNISEIGLRPQLMRKSSTTSLNTRRARSTAGSITSTSKRPSPTPPSPLTSPTSSSSPDTAVSHPDLENFDPTYGLRPEGLPTKSVFRGFSSLFHPNKGLADLAEESSELGEEYGEDEGDSFDFVDWDDGVPGSEPSPSVYNERERERESPMEYETIPAVGGGTITRPRIYHSQSAIQNNIPLSKSLSSLPTRSRSQMQMNMFHSGMATPSLLSRHPSSASNPYFPEYPSAGPSKLNPDFVPRTAPPLGHTPGVRPATPDSVDSQASRSSSGRARTLSTDPTTDHIPPRESSHSHSHSDEPALYMRRPATERRLSVTSNGTTTSNMEGSSLDHHTAPFSLSQDSPKIVLRPSLNNNSIHQLSTLSHSFHTLSPVPPRGAGAGGVGGHAGGWGKAVQVQVVKAKRKRTYHLGGKKVPTAAAVKRLPQDDEESYLDADEMRRARPRQSVSPTPPSEFDVEDMDRYFRTHEGDEMPLGSRQATLRPRVGGRRAQRPLYNPTPSI
ncbi:hypothetical protein B0H34DRAFT_831825 [Crassisporium funariophilum]|nr:hypothetical protein B0H34DRAFT_831825 [Crassisporium funariophilum]